MKSAILKPLVLLPLALLGVGCAATPATTSDAAAPPPDFMLSMTVMSHPAHRRATAIPREVRPARFVMETDWVLRSYAGPGAADPDTFPPETRQLNDRDVSMLWNDLKSAGLLDPANPAIVGRAPSPSDIAADHPLWVIWYSADAAERTLVLDASANSPAAPFFNHLADLAWMHK